MAAAHRDHASENVVRHAVRPSLGRWSRRRWQQVGACAVALLLTACAGGDAAKSCVVSRVSITPNSATLEAGATAVLVPSVTATDCATIPTASWSTSAAGIATVSPSGVVTAIAPGTAVIGTSIAGASATANITVTVPTVRTITVSVPTASMVAGSTQQATAVLRDALNQTLSGRVVAWSSSAPTVATVNATSGAISAIGAGTAIVTATSEGASGTVQITVVPVPIATITVAVPNSTMLGGTTQTATAVLRDAAGQLLNGRAVTWISPSPTIASVNATTGVITAVAAGTSQIIASADGVTGSVTITVIAPVASVSVGFPSTNLATGVTQTATAVVRDASNQALAGRSVIWSSTNTAVASIDATTGVITGVSAGSTTIQATSEGQTGSAALTIVQVPRTGAISPNVVSAVFKRFFVVFGGSNFANDFASWAFAVGPSDAITGFDVVSRPSSSSSGAVLRVSIADPSSRADTYVAFARTVSTELVLGNQRSLSVYPVGSAPQEIGGAIGGTGGVPFAPISCPAGSVATGIGGRAVAYVDQVSLRCKTVTGTARTFGGTLSTASAGPDNGTPFTLECPANHVLVGISARSLNNGGWITAIAGLCRPVDLGDLFLTPYVGSALTADMTEQVRTCSSGLAVVGFEGNSGLYVDKIALRCR